MIDFKVAVILSCVLLSVAGQQGLPSNTSLEETVRSFGNAFMRRISPTIIPGAFIIGAVFTLLAALTVVSMNGLGVGVSGLIFKARLLRMIQLETHLCCALC